MTGSGTADLRVQGGSAEDFGQALRALFAAAGNPTLTATAAAVSVSGGDRVSVQKLSNWCSGRHLPDRFDTIAPVLVWLIVRARDQALAASSGQARAAEAPAGPGSIRHWYRLFTTAKAPTTSGDHTAAIGAAELLLAHPDPGVDAHLAEEQIAAAIVQLTGIDPTTGEPVATDVPATALPADAADLLSAAGLTITAPASTHTAELVRWADASIPLLWDRAAPLIERHHLALAARTGLLADAARWHAQPDPHTLYTWQQLTTCGRHLHTLPPAIVTTTEGTTALAAQPPTRAYRFGDGATAEHIPSPALPFWDASHTAAERQLTVHRLIMATVIAVIALAVITAAIAGALTS
ncbi:hypothetical protein [Tsukamurella pseudospumae]|uniref:Uncharacterized protein n=1 Tax=Tsukamurella pseudospumae TaxID=239498 RepID=A0A138AQ19_9ACTN|nr:hypothetical protein [Tsukamurella pseudospumae]KXP12537.1 hypothetical protein AXK60_04780 [Tsukamurella pseudospumae]